MGKSSKIIGGIIQIGGIVLTIIAISNKDINTKVVFSIIGLVVTFIGRFIKEYELLD